MIFFVFFFFFFFFPYPLFSCSSVLLLGLVLYALFVLVTIVASVRHLLREGSSRRLSSSGMFYVLVLLFLGFRITWSAFSLFLPLRQYLAWAFNVGSDCLFFTCWTLIVLHWAETNFRSTPGDPRLFSSVVGWIFLATNVVLYLFQASVIIYVSQTEKNDNQALILTSILVAILENVILGIGFLIFGLRLYCIVQSARSTIADEATLGQRSSIRTTLVVTVIMTACFLGRSILYIVQVTTAQGTNELMSAGSIPRVVLVFVSELVPISYQLWLQRSRKKQEEKHTRFIQDLYEQNDTVSSDNLDTDSLLSKPIIN